MKSPQDYQFKKIQIIAIHCHSSNLPSILFCLHALWYIRVWSIRVSTRFLKKIRVYKCPFSGKFKGIFLCEYSDCELIKSGYKGTHQYSFKGSHKAKLLTFVYFSKCCHTIEQIVERKFYQCNASTNPRSELHG